MRGSFGAVIGKYPSSDGTVQMGGDGIIKHNRKCRDLVFLVIFIAFWVGMIVNSSFAFNQGNPLRYIQYEGKPTSSAFFICQLDLLLFFCCCLKYVLVFESVPFALVKNKLFE